MIGDHRLLVGSALEPSNVISVLGDERARLILTDPPYNVPITGHVSTSDRHREFAMASGEMSEDEFREFLETAFLNAKAGSCDGALIYTFLDWRSLEAFQSVLRRLPAEIKNLCVWVKTNAGMGSLYRSRHELVLVAKLGDAPHVNNVELGRHGRNRTNVWTHPGCTVFGKKRDAALGMHPTVKPVGLLADIIRDASKRGEIVFDPFAGSGSTLVAAAREGRRGFGVEIDPAYADTIVARVSEVAGVDARCARTGESFAERRASRIVSGEGSYSSKEQQR